MKDIHFTIGLIGKSSLLPLCVIAPGCYACVYETSNRARHLGVVERAAVKSINKRGGVIRYLW